MKAVNPYLNFPGNTAEAFAFYGSVFGGESHGLLRYRDMGGEAMGVKGADLDKVAHVAIPLGKDHMLMGTDVIPGTGQPPVTMGNNFYIALEAESADEARRLFEGLSAGGNPEMPPEKTGWAELHGSCVDRFGVRWMITYTGSVTFEMPRG